MPKSPDQRDCAFRSFRILRHTYHGVRERSGNSDGHPPHQALEKVLPLAAHQVADQATIQLRHVQTEHRPQHEEDTVAGEQSQLLAPPARDDNPQQAEQIPQELAVDLDLLPRHAAVAHAAGSRPPPQLRLALGSGLLLGDGIPDALDQGQEEGQVHCTGDAGAVLEIEAGQAGGELPDRALGGEQFGLRSHGDGERRARSTMRLYTDGQEERSTRAGGSMASCRRAMGQVRYLMGIMAHGDRGSGM